MLIILLSVAVSAPTAVSPSPPVIVTGKPIEGARAALQACLARNCPTNEDIDASLALAENQIIAGKYHDARQTLLKSLKRNKSEADRYPVPVSDLYRANGRVSAHLGLDRDYYTSTWGIYRTLKYGLPDEKYRQFSALMEVAEMMGERRGHLEASRYYASVARQAREAGRPDIAALAELRALIRHSPPGSDRNREIEKIADSADPAVRAAALEAKLALARMAFERNDTSTGETLLADFARFGIKRPILVYQPPYEMNQHDPGRDELPNIPPTDTSRLGGAGGGHVDPRASTAGGGGAGAGRDGALAVSLALSTTGRMAGNLDDMWIDVSFGITPQGTVSDLKVVRKKGNTFWTKPLLAAIQNRRYTPGRVGDPNSIRLERYTYTSGWQDATGTHMAERSPAARVEYFDLSEPGAAVTN